MYGSAHQSAPLPRAPARIGLDKFLEEHCTRAFIVLHRGRLVYERYFNGGSRDGEIVERVDVGQSTVSTHLRLLAETCFVFVDHRGTSSYFQINESCIECFPSAAELVMGNVRQDRMPAPRPGATSRRRRGESSPDHNPARTGTRRDRDLEVAP
jgi:hypothetical protein